MTKEDLKAELKAIELQAEKDKRAAYIKYAQANNPYKVGDIISDHIGTLKIEKIGFNVYFGDAECVYTGIELKKDHTPVKKQTGRQVYQSNIETK